MKTLFFVLALLSAPAFSSGLEEPVLSSCPGMLNEKGLFEPGGRAKFDYYGHVVKQAKKHGVSKAFVDQAFSDARSEVFGGETPSMTSIEDIFDIYDRACFAIEKKSGKKLFS